MLLLLSFFFFFNDRLEQRDLRNYKTDFHQIFRNGRYVGVDVQSGIGFAIGQRMLPWPWQQILGAKSAEIGDTSPFLGLAFHNGWQDGKKDGRVNSAEVMSTSYKNLMNFGPLTPEITVIIWRVFMRQMREIGETRSILGTRIRQWMAGTTGRICAKFTRNMCLVLRWHGFECQGQKSKVKVTRKKKRAVHSQRPRGMDEMERAHCKYRHASSRCDDSIAADGCLRRDVCSGPGGLPLGSSMRF